MPGTRRIGSAALVEFEWFPDPVVFQAKIFAVAEALEDRTVPIIYARQKVQADIQERFKTETAPDGTPWDDWAQSYEPYAEAFPNVGILRQTDELYEMATASSASVPWTVRRCRSCNLCVLPGLVRPCSRPIRYRSRTHWWTACSS